VSQRVVALMIDVGKSTADLQRDFSLWLKPIQPSRDLICGAAAGWRLPCDESNIEIVITAIKGRPSAKGKLLPREPRSYQ
jgi:hypothetical protein